jgi:FkbM family methyltransferase
MKKIINYAISLTSGHIYTLLRNILEIIFYKKRFSLFYENNFYIRKYYNFRNIYFSHKERTRMYGRGYKFRLHSLEKIYFLDKIKFNNLDIVIDCGSNIGEVGLIFKLIKKNIKYIAFEPSKLEFLCLKKNMKENKATLHNVALWKNYTNLNFYIKSQTADSSLFKIKKYDYIEKVKCKKLDDYFFNKKIKLLKIEAEGAEPEVLIGAEQTIKLCEYISVDAGPERGIEQKTTIKEVKQFLLSRNFTLIQKSFDRVVLLFKNKKYF